MIIINVKDYGTMKLELDRSAAKNTCANFVSLVKKGFYDGLIFHRIIKGFMIQGGAGEPKGRKVGYCIKGEFNSNGIENPLRHARGVISMARTSYPDSASSQFFICHKDAPHLDGEYAAFGKLIEGFDVLDKIASVQTDFRDFPYPPVVIDSIVAIDEPDEDVEKLPEDY